MKTLLISFAVLLFLLTLLSSFGGSIRSEPFYDANPAIEPTNPTTPPTYNFSAPSYDNTIQTMENAPAPPEMPPIDIPKVENKAAEAAGVPVPEPEQFMQMPPFLSPPETYVDMQKVDNVPAPFANNEYGAPLP